MNTDQGRVASARPDTDELAAAEVVRYRLRQRFSYSYTGHAYNLRHRLVVVPPAVHADQRLRLGSVEVSSPDAEVIWRGDEDGNRTTSVRLAVVPETVDMMVSVVVERGCRGRAAVLQRAPRQPHAPADPADHRPTSASGPSPASTRWPTPRRPPTTSAAWSRPWWRTGSAATDVDTPAADALAGGMGVCQDQAHVMLAMCRSVGVRARYVSGHLIGQGGTHAWVEVLVPDGLGARAVAFDPCHGRRADRRYVTIATGRDYRDVAPTSGSYSGQAVGELTTSRALTAEIVA